jgi:hypothetical protein
MHAQSNVRRKNLEARTAGHNKTIAVIHLFLISYIKKLK